MFLLTALVSFTSFWLILSHIGKPTMRKLVGYKGVVDVCLHGTIIMLFIGTSTIGLLQAEAAGIMFSIYLRLYAKLAGYARLVEGKWVEYPGTFST